MQMDVYQLTKAYISTLLQLSKQKPVVQSIGKLSQFHYVGCTLHACRKKDLH